MLHWDDDDPNIDFCDYDCALPLPDKTGRTTPDGDFGDEYQRYSRTTPRFIPTFMSYSEPEMICVEPRLLMKGLFGIAFLQLLIAVVVFLEVLHDTNLAPTFFYIY